MKGLYLSIVAGLASAFHCSDGRRGSSRLTMRASVDDATSSMKSAAAANEPFTSDELDSALRSLSNVGLSDDGSLRALLSARAHGAPKDWASVEKAAIEFQNVVGADAFASAFERALEGGGMASAVKSKTKKPWVVLVTGLNGIRKTSSIYEPWFADVLYTALGESVPREELPVGGNSFFRQLDYIVATVANEAFRELYEIGDVEPYARRKDAIFTRFRTWSEIVGARLLIEAKKEQLNVLVETSGRDIGMFQYIEHFFPADDYRKLVLNFEINEIEFAESSVERRMVGEMRAGVDAVATGETSRIIRANAGGPYGPSALAGVQKDSVAVFSEVEADERWDHWLKARIQIDAHKEKPWTVRAKGAPKDQAFAFGDKPLSATTSA